MQVTDWLLGSAHMETIQIALRKENLKHMWENTTNRNQHQGDRYLGQE